MALDRRVEVLFASDEHERLQSQANARGISVGELVRDAVRRQVLEPDASARLEAGRRFTSGEMASGLARAGGRAVSGHKARP